MLQTSNLNIIKAICEILLNVYYKHIQLSSKALNELKKHKTILIKLISTKKKGSGDLSAKKDLLIKHSDSFVAIKEIFEKK